MYLYFGFFLPCLRCCGCKEKKELRRMKLFKQAKKRYEEDLDVLRIMQTVKQSANFLKSYLSHENKLLLKFDNTNVIAVSSSDADGDKEKEYKSDSDNNDRDDRLIENLNHKEKLRSIFALGKLKKCLMPLIANGQLEPFKVRLLKSYFTKKDLVRKKPLEIKQTNSIRDSI